MDQLEAVADFQFLFRGIIVEALDMLPNALDLLGIDGVALLHFLDETLLLHECVDAVRPGQGDKSISHDRHKNHSERPSCQRYFHLWQRYAH